MKWFLILLVVAGAGYVLFAPKSAPPHGNLVELARKHRGDLTNADRTPFQVAAKPYTFLYFSAAWCPPCHAFTPRLVEFYQKAGSARDFEVIFISSDESAEAMAAYREEMAMPWAAATFESAGAAALLASYGERGIPNLVLIDGTGAVVGRSFEGGNYRGPDSVLARYQELH